MKERFGAAPPEFGYKDLVAEFQAEHFNPDDWAKLFNDAGAKYVVFTAEHHDGFALWESELTDWCATKKGPMRDLVGDLGQSVRKYGIKYGPSYHRARHPSYYATELYRVESEPRPDIAEELEQMPSAEGLYGPFSYTDEFIEDYVARWQEIQRKYRPDFLWIDDIPIFYHEPDNPQTKKFQDACAGMIADYLNAGEKWGVEVFLNNKGKNKNWPANLGCLERDNMQVVNIGEKWENPATLATSYGYLKAEEVGDLYQSSEKFVQLLCDVVSKNGNLLLNIGPRGDGTIPEGMQQRLLGIGEWLKVNGEAIYGSRPWKVYGEGVIPNQKLKDELGRHTINSTGIRFTQSKDGKHIYVMQFDQSDSPFTVESFKGMESMVKTVTLLGDSNPVSWEIREDALIISPPNARKVNKVAVYKVSL